MNPHDRHPQCLYALTLGDLQDDWNYSVPSKTHHEQREAWLPFFVIELGIRTRQIAVRDAFIGEPFIIDGRIKQWSVKTAEYAQHREPIDLAAYGIVVMSHGSWASRYCVADSQAYWLVDQLLHERP
ncbi:MAG: hypothetical protein ACHQTE_02440 [Candidatus Saccharimonadales bacterium]